MFHRSRAGLVLAAVAALAGCTSTAAPSTPTAGGAITVSAGDTTCAIATAEAPAGTISFAVTNTGTKVTEFYLYGTGDRIMGEAENIGPGLSRQLIVEVPDGGTYTTACRPGMAGDGIRAAFTVTGSAARSTQDDSRLAEAVASYKRYALAQIESLVPAAQVFADAVRSGDVAAAKALYPTSRTFWERVEPVADSFGDIDPKIDGRESDDRAPGVAFTGYHRLERDLWATGLQPDSPAIAEQLMTDIKDLQTRAATFESTPVQLANGAKELLDEVATTKVTGEEDRHSHTDLWDLAANVDGSRAAIATLRPVIDEKDPALGPALDARFKAVDDVLATFRVGDGLRPYTELTPDDVKKLAAAVDALGEPVSQVAGIVSS